MVCFDEEPEGREMPAPDLSTSQLRSGDVIHLQLDVYLGLGTRIASQAINHRSTAVNYG